LGTGIGLLQPAYIALRSNAGRHAHRGLPRGWPAYVCTSTPGAATLHAQQQANSSDRFAATQCQTRFILGGD
ncbi:MAG: hypothetical protein QF662_07845, partial [Phycisphaerae bacterium]|nr:hypothetical protein [Phycisphaerae bacterium]